MTVAVVIPALNEEARLPRTLARTSELGFDRIVVVDGGSTDRTRAIVEAFPAPIVLLSSPPCRALQMNAGAASGREDVLLFLHADTLLPPNAREAVEGAMQDPACVGGRFDLRFDREGPWAWLISRLVNLRSRWTRIATGDQAIFVRRTAFERLRGFADLPLMEDVEFTRRLKRLGRLAALRAQVTTSFRRWRVGGPLRTVLLMWTLRFLYWAGISPQRLSTYYRVVR